LNYFIEHYFYKGRILLFIPLIYLLTEYCRSVPTREIVHSDLFLYSIFLLSSYATLFLYMYSKSLKTLLLMIVPAPFVLLSKERYNGGVDTGYEILFYIVFFLIVIQLLLWFISLFFKTRSLDEAIEESDKSNSQDLLKRETPLEKKKPYTYGLNIRASIKNSHKKVASIIITERYDCIYIAELIGCERSINFTAQYLDFLKTGKSTTISYPIICSYFKFGEYHQIKDVYMVTLY